MAAQDSHSHTDSGADGGGEAGSSEAAAAPLNPWQVRGIAFCSLPSLQNMSWRGHGGSWRDGASGGHQG